MRLAGMALAALLLAAGIPAQVAHAQEAPAPAAPAPEQITPTASVETIQIGLSTDRVVVTSDFSGADLTIFGAIGNLDPLVSRQGRYDVVVVLEGPARPVVVRKKTRVLGMWINTESHTFVNVPASYSVAMTRMPQDITTPDTYRQLSLGQNYIYLEPLARDGDPMTIEEFTAALRQQKELTGLYVERIGGVVFLSDTLFRATLALAPNIPLGTHRARAFLFRNGVFVKESSVQLSIAKSGFEQQLFSFAKNQGFIYGLLAVLLAVITGWLGRLVFRKD
jgi:uncharacterized protein (TIGR02186 family)